MSSESAMIKYFVHVDRKYPELGLKTMLSTTVKIGDPRVVKTLTLPLARTCCADPDGCGTIASAACRATCYFWQMSAGRPEVAQRAEKNWLIAQRDDFDLVLSVAIKRANLQYFRPLDFGDVFSVVFIDALTRAARICSNVSCWLYSRGWQRPEFVEPLARLAELGNVCMNLSADPITGMPPAIPHTRVAWFAPHDSAVPPAPVDIVFRGSRQKTPDGYAMPLPTLGGSVVCPHQNGIYSSTNVVIDIRGRTKKKKLGPAGCSAATCTAAAAATTR